MKAALALKLAEDIGTVVASSAAAVPMFTAAKRKSSEIVDLAADYEVSRLQHAPNPTPRR